MVYDAVMFPSKCYYILTPNIDILGDQCRIWALTDDQAYFDKSN